METLVKHPKIHIFSNLPFFVCQCTGQTTNKRFGLPGLLVLKNPTKENATNIYGVFADWNVCARWLDDRMRDGRITHEKYTMCMEFIIDTIGVKTASDFHLAPPFDALLSRTISSGEYFGSYLRYESPHKGTVAQEYSDQQQLKEVRSAAPTNVRMDAFMMKKAPEYLRQFVVTTCPDLGAYHIEEQTPTESAGSQWLSEISGITWPTALNQTGEYDTFIHRPPEFNKKQKAFIKRMTVPSEKKPKKPTIHKAVSSAPDVVLPVPEVQ